MTQTSMTCERVGSAVGCARLALRHIRRGFKTTRARRLHGQAGGSSRTLSHCIAPFPATPRSCVCVCVLVRRHHPPSVYRGVVHARARESRHCCAGPAWRHADRRADAGRQAGCRAVGLGEREDACGGPSCDRAGNLTVLNPEVPSESGRRVTAWWPGARVLYHNDDTTRRCQWLLMYKHTVVQTYS